MTEKWTPEDEERLRRALHGEAAKIVPAPGGLDRILARTRSTPAWVLRLRSPAVLGMAAAALTAIAVVGAGFAVLRGPSDFTATPGVDVTTTAPQTPSPEPAPTPEPTDEPTPEVEPYTAPPEPPPTSPASPPEEPAVGFTGAVPVYYVAETSDGLRLAREWRRVESEHSAAEAAVDLLFEPSNIPGYESLWNEDSEVRSVDVRQGAIEVDLSLPPGPEPIPATHAALAVQQLVYTATGAVSVAGGDGSLPVRVLVEGGQVGQLAGADLAAAVGRADPLDVRMLVQLNDPYQGQSTTSPVRVSGDAAVFEATVEWEVRQDGEVVADGFATTAEAFRFTEFAFEVDLPPGEYAVVVSESDPAGGEGRAPMSDSRTFVVTD